MVRGRTPYQLIPLQLTSSIFYNGSTRHSSQFNGALYSSWFLQPGRLACFCLFTLQRTTLKQIQPDLLSHWRQSWSNPVYPSMGRKKYSCFGNHSRFNKIDSIGSLWQYKFSQLWFGCLLRCLLDASLQSSMVYETLLWNICYFAQAYDHVSASLSHLRLLWQSVSFVKIVPSLSLHGSISLKRSTTWLCRYVSGF